MLYVLYGTSFWLYFVIDITHLQAGLLWAGSVWVAVSGSRGGLSGPGRAEEAPAIRDKAGDCVEGEFQRKGE